MSKLALFGGEKEVKDDVSLRVKLPEEDAEALKEAIQNDLLYEPSGKGVIKELEERFADFLGKKHALAVSSGTMALFSAYFGIGLNQGEEVLAPCYAYHASVFPMIYHGGVPTFTEIESKTLNIDVTNLDGKVNSLTTGMGFVPMWGLAPDYRKILEFKRKHNLSVVEDASRSLGAERDGIKAGDVGDVVCASLNTYKIVGIGEGGILATDDEEIYDRTVALGQPTNFNISSDDYFRFFETALGVKTKIHPVSAFLALRALERFPQSLQQSNENFGHLRKRLEGLDFLEILTPNEGSTRGGWSGASMVYHPERIDGLEKDRFLEVLKAEGCALMPEYTSNLLHTTPAYQINPINGRRPRYAAGDFSFSEGIIHRTLMVENLCAYHRDTSDVIDRHVDAIRKVFDNRDELL